MTQRLRIVFDSAEDLNAEYQKNIANAGLFIATEEDVEFRETVEVQIALTFASEHIVLEGEVVHRIVPDQAPAGVKPGVAVQFKMSPQEIREKFAPYMSLRQEKADVPDAANAETQMVSEEFVVEGNANAEASEAATEVSFQEPTDSASTPDLEDVFNNDAGLFDEPEKPGDVESKAEATQPVSSDAETVISEKPPAPKVPSVPKKTVQKKVSAKKEPHPPPERRRSVRTPARLEVCLAIEKKMVTGSTRNISTSGTLVTLHGDPIDVGSPLVMTLIHPKTETDLRIQARVVRHVGVEGGVVALGLQFVPTAADEEGVSQFIQDVQASEGMRYERLISGPFTYVGAANLMQAFSASAVWGSFVFLNGNEEGSVSFLEGFLRSARVGPVTGLKALARILSWQEGIFEFSLDEVDEADENSPGPIFAAMMEATRQMDEVAKFDNAQFPLSALVKVHSATVPAGSEQYADIISGIFDLGTAGFTFRGILDVIPETDGEIYQALSILIEGGMVELDLA